MREPGEQDPMTRLVERVQAEPHSAAALTLYALASTLDQERAGYLFKLEKLRDLDAVDRRLAYDLMELMARGGNSGDAWRQARAALDRLVRAG